MMIFSSLKGCGVPNVYTYNDWLHFDCMYITRPKFEHQDNKYIVLSYLQLCPICMLTTSIHNLYMYFFFPDEM